MQKQHSRISKSNNFLKSSKFNPYVLIIVVLILSLAGILIIRYSQAGTPLEFSNYEAKNPPQTANPISYNSISLKFKPSAKVSIKNGQFSSPSYDMTAFNKAVFGTYNASSVNKIFSGIDTNVLQDQAEKNSGQIAPDLDLYYEITLSSSYNTIEMSNYLRKYYFVDTAYSSPGEAVTLPSQDYSSIQFYRLDKISNLPTPLESGGKQVIANSDYGMNLKEIESLPGADGKNVSIFNIDGGYDKNHEDISKFKVQGGFVSYINTAAGEKELSDPVSSGSVQHGVATVSITSADKNNFGVTGLVPASKLYYTTGNYLDSSGVKKAGFARAITKATSILNKGDVITISMGYSADPFKSGKLVSVPVGYLPEEKEAIRLAVQKGIYVLVSAGNDNSNYNDTAIYGADSYLVKPYGTSADDPGQFLIGAVTPGPWCLPAGPSPDGSKISFSTYGSRVGPSSWGACVASAGYYQPVLSETGTYTRNPDGSLVLNDPNYSDNYTMTFNGTSSAAPLVASVVASFSSTFEEKNKFSLTPKELYQKLIATGKPQVTTGANVLQGNVGPIPNAGKLFKDSLLFPDQKVTPPPAPPAKPPTPPAPKPPASPPPPPPPPPPPTPPPPESEQGTPAEIIPEEPIISDEISEIIAADFPEDSQNREGTNEDTINDSAPAPQEETTGIQDALFTSLTPKDVVLSWTTAQKTTAKVLFGKGEDLKDSVSSPSSTNHSVVLPVSKFTSGETYNYKIVSTDASGKVEETEPDTFTFPGYSLNVKVLSGNDPVSNATVSLGQNKVFTNSKGIAELKNVPSGTQTVTIEYDKKKQTGQVVVNEQLNKVQEYNVKLVKSSSSNWSTIALGAVIVLLVAVVGFIVVRRISNKSNL